MAASFISTTETAVLAFTDGKNRTTRMIGGE